MWRVIIYSSSVTGRDDTAPTPPSLLECVLDAKELIVLVFAPVLLAQTLHRPRTAMWLSLESENCQ
jgi:hypothetical protein